MNLYYYYVNIHDLLTYKILEHSDVTDKTLLPAQMNFGGVNVVILR